MKKCVVLECNAENDAHPFALKPIGVEVLMCKRHLARIYDGAHPVPVPRIGWIPSAAVDLANAAEFSSLEVLAASTSGLGLLLTHQANPAENGVWTVDSDRELHRLDGGPRVQLCYTVDQIAERLGCAKEAAYNLVRFLVATGKAFETGKYRREGTKSAGANLYYVAPSAGAVLSLWLEKL